MTVGWVLLILGAASSFFGCGFFYGSLVTKHKQVVSLNFPRTAANIAGPLTELQRTMRHIELGLRHHGHRLTTDAATLHTAGLPAAQAKILEALIEANQGFEKQVNHWADNVRRTGQQFTTQGANRPTNTGHDHKGREATSSTDAIDGSMGSQRRRERRHPFCCEQWIAPYNGIRAPEPEEFFRVQCRDISSSGISFFVHRKPNYELIVVRLPSQDKPKYLTARIQRCTPCENTDFGEYSIGCFFLGSLHAKTLAPNLEASIRRRERLLAESECAD